MALDRVTGVRLYYRKPRGGDTPNAEGLVDGPGEAAAS